MREALESPSLVREPPNELWVPAAHDLHRDRDSSAHVKRLIDIGHPASTDQANETVVSTESFCDQCHGRAALKRNRGFIARHSENIARALRASCEKVRHFPESARLEGAIFKYSDF